MPKNFTKYYEAVEYLESIPIMSKADYFTKKSGRSLFLKRFEYFLNLIGNPHRQMRYFHISGSSGKGSVANMVQSILIEAKYKTGLYTSPYCTTSIEKIKIDNLFIDPEEFAEIVKKLKSKIEYAHKNSPYGRPSYFEIFTAIAFLYFKKAQCEYVVLEVGLGGSFDATNIIPFADITIINLIDFDHVNILGNKLTTIAREKSAIIKPRTEVFTTSKNNKDVLNIFRKVCLKNKVKLNIIKPPVRPYQLPVLGIHQQENAELAAKACQEIGVKKNQIKAGLKKIKLPCRFEVVKKNPTVIIDGAHNFSKVDSTVTTLKKLTYKKLYLIIALTRDRDPKKIFKTLIPLADYIVCTKFKSTDRKPLAPKDLAKAIKNKNDVIVDSDSTKALTNVLSRVRKDDVVLVTGSLYLAGELRKKYYKEELILKKRKI
ncbi:MAG: hypothetical protein CMI53_05155 [Parcubacteria group bacterium]|nr:hypothetical protein [Parcubacteria group bacterium]|tara:strand:+ start:13675 stop:14964 length:1290 start_codon:yes stop_codon:yes gene_type:complete